MQSMTTVNPVRGTLRPWDNVDAFDTNAIERAIYRTHRYTNWRRERGTGQPNVNQLKSMLTEERSGNG
jgi:hypothetical protein